MTTTITPTPAVDAVRSQIVSELRKNHQPIHEDKAGFVDALNAALIVYGDGRYDHLIETPLTYVPVYRDGRIVSEHVTLGSEVANVTGDSLTGMLGDIYKQILA